ncbi:hypothetical protein MAM1_0165d07042 [Mucor ambiguus]|uniref:Uncharacterized protein n=1 Tax=Mucor ambiguus TaxID=91626 RepID=A0A0C9MZ36_9FUNG|nr:hypothetical protein MAM1_0165d07042 [Mucor ambiguus]
MAEFVINMEFDPPTCCILDINVSNGNQVFSNEEKIETNKVAKAPISYPPLLTDMRKLLHGRPNIASLDNMHSHLEVLQLNLSIKPQSMYLKGYLEHAIQSFMSDL